MGSRLNSEIIRARHLAFQFRYAEVLYGISGGGANP
jgi:hypothetical protein